MQSPHLESWNEKVLTTAATAAEHHHSISQHYQQQQHQPQVATTSGNTTPRGGGGFVPWRGNNNNNNNSVNASTVNMSGRVTPPSAAAPPPPSMLDTDQMFHHHQRSSSQGTATAVGGTSTPSPAAAYISSSIAGSFADMAALESQMKSKYEHKMRVVSHAILQSLSDELPADHILLQLFSDRNTEEFVKLRVAEVVESSIMSHLGSSYNALIGELSRKEVENVYLLGKLDELANASAAERDLLHAQFNEELSQMMSTMAAHQSSVDVSQLHKSTNMSNSNVVVEAETAAAGGREKNGSSSSVNMSVQSATLRPGSSPSPDATKLLNASAQITTLSVENLDELHKEIEALKSNMSRAEAALATTQVTAKKDTEDLQTKLAEAVHQLTIAEATHKMAQEVSAKELETLKVLTSQQSDGKVQKIQELTQELESVKAEVLHTKEQLTQSLSASKTAEDLTMKEMEAVQAQIEAATEAIQKHEANAEKSATIIQQMEQDLLDKEEQVTDLLQRMEDLHEELEEKQVAVEETSLQARKAVTSADDAVASLQERFECATSFIHTILNTVLLSHDGKAKERSIASTASRMLRAMETHAQRPHELIDEVCLLSYSAVSSTLALFSERAMAVEKAMALLPEEFGVKLPTAAGRSTQDLLGTPAQQRQTQEINEDDTTQLEKKAAWSPSEKKQLIANNVKDCTNFEDLAQQLVDSRQSVSDAATDVKQGVKLLKGLNKDHEELQAEVKGVLQKLADVQRDSQEKIVHLEKETDRVKYELQQEQHRYTQLDEAHKLVLAGTRREEDASLVEGVASAATTQVNQLIATFNEKLTSQIQNFQEQLTVKETQRSVELNEVVNTLKTQQADFNSRQVEAVLEPIRELVEHQVSESRETISTLVTTTDAKLVEEREKASDASMHHQVEAANSAAFSHTTALLRSCLSVTAETHDTAAATMNTSLGMNNSKFSSATNQSATVTVDFQHQQHEELLAVATSAAQEVQTLRQQNAVLKKFLRTLTASTAPHLRRQTATMRQQLHDLKAYIVKSLDAMEQSVTSFVTALTGHSGETIHHILSQCATIVLELVNGIHRNLKMEFDANDDGTNSHSHESQIKCNDATFVQLEKLVEQLEGHDKEDHHHQPAMASRDVLRKIEEFSRRLTNSVVADALHAQHNTVRKLESMMVTQQQQHDATLSELRVARSSVDVTHAAALSQMEKAKQLVAAANEKNSQADAKANDTMNDLFEEKAEAEREILRVKTENAELRAQFDASDRNQSTEIEKLEDKISTLTKQLVAQEKRNGVLHERCSVKEKENVRLQTIFKQQQLLGSNNNSNTSGFSPSSALIDAGNASHQTPIAQIGLNTSAFSNATAGGGGAGAGANNNTSVVSTTGEKYSMIQAAQNMSSASRLSTSPNTSRLSGAGMSSACPAKKAGSEAAASAAIVSARRDGASYSASSRSTAAATTTTKTSSPMFSSIREARQQSAERAAASSTHRDASITSSNVSSFLMRDVSYVSPANDRTSSVGGLSPHNHSATLTAGVEQNSPFFSSQTTPPGAHQHRRSMIDDEGGVSPSLPSSTAGVSSPAATALGNYFIMSGSRGRDGSADGARASSPHNVAPPSGSRRRPSVEGNSTSPLFQRAVSPSNNYSSPPPNSSRPAGSVQPLSPSLDTGSNDELADSPSIAMVGSD